MTPSDLARDYWSHFCKKGKGPDHSEPYQVWFFGDSRELAAELAVLVLNGTKTATATLVWEAEFNPDNAPIQDGYSVVTDFDGIPKCIIQTTGIEIVPYDEVAAEFAWDEGEGDRSLEYWRRIHWDYFSRRCTEMGRIPDSKMLVMCERFRLIYP